MKQPKLIAILLFLAGIAFGKDAVMDVGSNNRRYHQSSHQINRRGSSPIIEIDSLNLYINGEKIPRLPSKDTLEAVLGKPSREDRKPKGTRYIYDNYGISFRTDVDSDIVSNITLFYNRMFWPRDYAPSRTFTGGELLVNGKKFPKSNSLQDAMEAIPEIKPDPRSWGSMHKLSLGKRTLSVFTPSRKQRIVTVTIDLSYDTAKLDELLKQSQLLEK